MGKRSLLAKIYRKLHKMVNKSNKVKRTSEDIQVPDVKGSPSIYHAVIIIFLEFFAWGLLTTPMMNVLKETFGDETFLMNGITQGIKGILSFISAPLLGALSDVWGRKPFLLLSVFFTCAPIPLMIISPWSFFTLISLSGAFAVTFSIIFAYVADITDETNRSSAYGLVSATFAASLVTSPAIGTYLESIYNLGTVVTIATIIFLTDFFFILLFVPESLNMEKQHDEEQQQTSTSNGRRRSTTNTTAVLPLTKTDFYGLFRNLGQESTLLMFCITVFLSYLPEAGQYSCIFVYLRHVIGFSDELVALYIAVVGILSILAQTAILTVLYQAIGNKATILLGLLFQIGQLLCYSFGREHWTMWMAGVLAALSSINYPALSSLASAIVSDDKQGVVQGMITGVRGLCNGLGPALFGVTFHIFNVELDPTTNVIQGSGPTSDTSSAVVSSQLNGNVTILPSPDQSILPGPPFLFGTLSAIMALMTAIFLPNHLQSHSYSPVAAQESDFVMKSSSLTDHNTTSSSSSRQTTRLSIVQHTSGRGGRDNNYESRISNYHDDSSGGATSGSDAEPPPPTLPLSRGHQDKYL